MTAKGYLNRSLRICYLNTQDQVIDAQRIALEKRLKLLGGEFSLHQVKGLSDPNFSPCDLLIIAAHKLPSESFPQWLFSFSEKIEAQGFIWVPALIISSASFITLKEVLDRAIEMNWYFDIMQEEHMDSMPIRVANLLRIHDHLHEMKRYEESLNALSNQLDQLTHTIKSLKGT